MISTSATNRSPARGPKPLIPVRYTGPFILVTGLFLLWGIPNNLNDVLIRQFMKSFEITRFEAGLVQSAFYMGYFLVSIPAAMVMRRHGYKMGLLIGLVLYSLGTFLFLPAALASSYSLFLLALFVIAGGLGFLETGANPLISQLGDPESSVRRLNVAQAFNPLGSICGVLIGTFFIFSGVELNPAQISTMKAARSYNAYLHQETFRVITPYIVLGVVVLAWGFLIAKTKFPDLDEPMPVEAHSSARQLMNLRHYRHFVWAIAAQFCYVGAQVGTWSYFIQYAQDYTDSSEKTAGYLLAGTLVGFALGRFLSSHLMKYMRADRLMGLFAMMNVLLLGIAALFPGWAGMWAIFATSFFMSLMFPTIFGLGLKGLGPSTKLGGSLLVMAIIGGAAFTPLIGLVYQVTKSMAHAMIVPLFCYIIVAYFAFWGCRADAPSTEEK